MSRTTTPAMAASTKARQIACVVLEVLAGLRTTQEASAALEISPQRYYTLEARAIEGMVAGVEPRPRGRGRRKRPGRELQELQAKCDQLERELRRANALVRVARRSIKLPATPSEKERAQAKKAAKAKGKRGPRRPSIRARRLVKKLRPDPESGRKEAS